MHAIKISPSHLGMFLAARTMGDTNAKAVRKDTWAAIRAAFRIPGSTKLKVELDDTRSPDYLIVKDKHSDTALWADESGAFVSVGQPHTSTVRATLGADMAPQPETQDVVRVISSAATVRYIRVGVSNLSQLADDYTIEADDVGVDIVNMADVGRVAYDKDTDAVLVRLG